MLRNRIVIFVFLLLIVSIFSSVVLSSSQNNLGPMDSPWPMKSHDVSHSGQSEYSTESNNGAELWKYKTYGQINGGIVVDKEGVLYFGDLPYLYALYSNGTLKWKNEIGRIWSTPALAEDGTIYIGSYSHKLYAFNPDGSLKWKFNAINSITSSPAIGSDGTIYFGTMGSPLDGERIYAVNPDGTLKWFYKTRNVITSDPAIGIDGTIYIGSMDRYIYALHPNGTLKWRYKTGDEIHSSPSIGPDGTVYFGSNDKYIYAVNSDGTLKWKYKVDGQLYGTVGIGDDGIIYAPDHDLFALYPNGTLKWRFDFGEELVVGSSPAIAKEGTIYIGVTKQGVSGGYIFAINSDGTERWNRKICDYWAESSPAIGSDGIVYIGSAYQNTLYGTYGYLYAFGEGNLEPEKPTIHGPSSGQILNSYDYTFQSIDPDGDMISYFIEWGDDSDSGWLGPYPSGTDITVSHTWIEKGTMSIRAKVKDEHDEESGWSTLSVTMPKTRSHVIFFHLWEQLLQHFPNISLLFNE